MKLEYTETTFKDSKWTLFSQGAAGGKTLTPYAYVAIQAPEHVAVEVFRKLLSIDPLDCYCEHCGPDYTIREVDDPAFLAHFTSHVSIYIIRADAIPYILKGIWELPRWVQEEEV